MIRRLIAAMLTGAALAVAATFLLQAALGQASIG